MQQYLNRFVQHLEGDPVKTRREFLKLVAAISKSSNVVLIFPDNRRLMFRKRSITDLESALERANKRKTNPVSFHGIRFVSLNSQKQKIALLALEKPKIHSLWKKIEAICRIYTFWESHHQLRSLVQKITEESSKLAKDYMQFTDQMTAAQKRLQTISKGILRTQEEERAKISRDLHDGIGQELTAIKMNLDMLSSRIVPALKVEDADRWNDTRGIAERTLQDVRELSRLLRPRMLDDLGLFPTLQWYVRNFSKRLGIPVDLLLEGEEERLNPEIQTILFRIAQEGLNNAAKHSRATSISVHLGCTNSMARLKIEDNGIGFEVKNSSESGSGISGMRDRVLLYKGTFGLDSRPQKGTRLEVVLPLM